VWSRRRFWTVMHCVTFCNCTRQTRQPNAETIAGSFCLLPCLPPCLCLSVCLCVFVVLFQLGGCVFNQLMATWVVVRSVFVPSIPLHTDLLVTSSTSLGLSSGAFYLLHCTSMYRH